MFPSYIAGPTRRIEALIPHGKSTHVVTFSHQLRRRSHLHGAFPV